MGGMGVVYFALDHGNDGRPVALKTFRPELLPDRAARDRFLREGTAWVELGSHPHIVRCYKEVLTRIGNSENIQRAQQLIESLQGNSSRYPNHA
jgi:serine/threonine protein kinase